MANKKVSQLVSKPSVLVTDLFPIADPTTGQLFKTTISDLGTAIGSGVSSVNTLVGAVVLDTDDIQELASPTNRWFTDTRARAAVSASSPLAYNSGTGVFSIPAATSSQNGYLTSTDWTTFNAKQAALSGTGFVKISGTTISYDNSTYLTTSAAASTYLALTGGTLTGALNGTSATFTGDLTISSGNPRLYFTDTDNNPDYFISNTDGTFTVYDVTNSTSRFTIGTTGNGTFGGNLTVGQIIRSGGTSSQFLKADGSVDSTAYLPLGGGTLTGALFATSASFSGFVGFGGNTSPLAAIDVTGAGIFSSSVRSSGYYLTGMTSGSGALYYSSGSNRVTVANYNTNGIVLFEVNGGSTALTLNANLSATFAGAISGTSATFSGAVNSQSLVIKNSGVPAAQFFRDLDVVSVGSAGQGIEFGARSGSTYIAGAAIYGGLDNPATTGNLVFQTLNGGSLGTRLTIANTGAATFSSSVTANGTLTVNEDGAGTKVLTIRSNWAGVDPAINVTTSNSLLLMTANTERMRITSGGNVGIGTTAPGELLHLSKATYPFIKLTETTASTSAQFGYDSPAAEWRMRTLTSTPLTFGINDTERMRITPQGYLKASNNGTYFNSTGSYHELRSNLADEWTTFISNSSSSPYGVYIKYASSSPNNTANFFFVCSDSTTDRLRIQANGNVVNTNNSYGAISDISLKENITDSSSKLTDLLKVKIKNYNLIGDSEKQLGVIAQELEEVFPKMVEIGENGLKSVKYSVFVPMLIKAVQELSDKITTLENK